MRIAIVGQQAFGKAALEAFLERVATMSLAFSSRPNRRARVPIRCARPRRQKASNAFN